MRSPDEMQTWTETQTENRKKNEKQKRTGKTVGRWRAEAGENRRRLSERTTVGLSLLICSFRHQERAPPEKLWRGAPGRGALTRANGHRSKLLRPTGYVYTRTFARIPWNFCFVVFHWSDSVEFLQQGFPHFNLPLPPFRGYGFPSSFDPSPPCYLILTLPLPPFPAESFPVGSTSRYRTVSWTFNFSRFF